MPAQGAPKALPRDGELSSRQSKLARLRLRQLALTMTALQLIDSVEWTLSRSLYQNPLMLRDLVVMNVAAAGLDLSLYALARNKRVSDQTVIRWWYVEHVLRCFVLATSPPHFGEMLGLMPPTMTFVCPAIIVFRVLVPLPRGTALVTLLAAATQPLAAAFVPVHPPSSWVIAGSMITATVAAAFALLCGRVTYGLTSAASSQELGAYQLIERLGEGLYGEVWRAKHRLLTRPAAIKTILAKRLTSDVDSTLRRFDHEAQVTAALSSPHTVTLYDYGYSEEGVVYLAMELLEGTDYEKYVDAHGPLEPKEVVRIALEVCDSLAEAHALDLVHHDLKPANLFRARMGLRADFTVVLDFGLAALRQNLEPRRSVRGKDLVLWDTLHLAGAPAFLPPELLLGAQWDARADLYQLGAVMHFLLTGKPLFDGDGTEETVRAHLRDAPPSLREASPYAVPSSLESTIQRCLARDPLDRFQNVETLEGALLGVARELMLGELPDRRALVAARSPSKREKAKHGSTKRKKRSVPTQGRRITAPLQTQKPFEGWTLDTLKQRFLRVWQRRVSAQPELVSAARARLPQFSYLAAALTATLTPLWFFLKPAPVRAAILPDLALATCCHLSLNFALIRTAQDRSISSVGVLRAAIGYFVITAYVLAVVGTRMSEVSGADLPRMGLPFLLVIVLPVFVPLSLRTLALPILLVGAAQPIVQAVLGSEDSVALVLGDSISNAVTATLAALILAHLTLRARERTVGRVYGAYTLVKKIGAGSMGEVWKASHSLLARPAAIKLIRSDAPSGASSSKRLRRFEGEAQLTASLTSPHTVTLYDYGVSGENDLYYAMELLRGRDLDRLVREGGPLTVESAVRVMRSICDSLAEAHTYGLVHRDLKPENVFCARIGRQADFVKVLDFGLARRLVRTAASGSAGSAIAGTPAYMAPEMFMGGNTSVRSDLYALGCILFFLLTGRPPYDRSTLAGLALAHSHERIPLPSEHTETAIPPALDAVVQRCLAKAPLERFSSALELSEALTAFLSPYPSASETRNPEATQTAFGP